VTRTLIRRPVWFDVLAYMVPGTPWRRAWAATRTTQDHADLVIAWLEGRYRFTTGHMGPPDPETESITAELVRINAAGLVTTNSQPGVLGADRHGRFDQRAYLHAYGPAELVERVARAAAAAGLWVETDPALPGCQTMPEHAPVTFAPETGKVWTTARLWNRDSAPMWDSGAVSWHRDSLLAWRTAPMIAVIDPEPGSNRLWDVVTGALTTA